MASVKKLPKGLTQKTVDELKKKHGKLQIIPVRPEDSDKELYCIVKKEIPKAVFRMAMGFMDKDDYRMMETLLKGCFVHGDEIIKEKYVLLAAKHIIDKIDPINVTVLPATEVNGKKLPENIVLADHLGKKNSKGDIIEIEILQVRVKETGEKFYGLITKELDPETIAKCVRLSDKSIIKLTDTLVYDTFIDGDEKIKSNAIYKFQIGSNLAYKLDQGESDILDL